MRRARIRFGEAIRRAGCVLALLPVEASRAPCKPTRGCSGRCPCRPWRICTNLLRGGLRLQTALAVWLCCVAVGCAAPPSRPSHILSVATLNMAHGRGLAPTQLGLSRERFVANIDAVAAVIKRQRPDVLAVQEADAPSTWSGSFDHVQHLAAAIEYPHIHHGIHFRADKGGLKLEYGTALLARRVLDTPASFRFAARPLDTKGFVTAEIEFDGRQLLVASAHLDARSASIRSRQVEKLISCLSSSGKPIVLMGDLNSRWSDESDAVRVLASRLGLYAYRPDHPELATFHTNGPSKRIDWILISPELEFIDCRVWPDQLSDHLAVAADLRWRD